MHVRRGGYIGVAPLPDGLANACVVTADRPAAAPVPRRCWNDTLRRDPVLRWPRSPSPAGDAASLSGAAGGRIGGVRRARAAAGRRRRRVHRSDDRRRSALRAPRRRARGRRGASTRWRTGAPTRTCASRPPGAASSPGKWMFNRALRSLVGSPLAVRAAALGAQVVARLAAPDDPLRRRSARRLNARRRRCSSLVFIPMLLEARRSNRNDRVLRAAGAVEPRGDVYRGDADCLSAVVPAADRRGWLRARRRFRLGGRRLRRVRGGQGAQVLGDRARSGSGGRSASWCRRSRRARSPARTVYLRHPELRRRRWRDRRRRV